MDNKNTMNTMIKLTKENVSFISNNLFFSLTIIPLIGFKGLEEETNMCEEFHCKEERRLWTVMETLHGCTHASPLF